MQIKTKKGWDDSWPFHIHKVKREAECKIGGLSGITYTSVMNRVVFVWWYNGFVGTERPFHQLAPISVYNTVS